nr:hypothetical protein CFP56_65103 [Quercus suber]
MSGFVPKSSFSNLPVPPPSATFTVIVSDPPSLIMEEQFLFGVKIAAAILSLLTLIAALDKYGISNYSSSGGESSITSTSTGGDVVVQVQSPAPNMTNVALTSV